MTTPKENDYPCCGKCSYYTDTGVCRVDQKRKNRSNYCDKFRIRLADHYVPNMWDDWKQKALREAGSK